MKYVISGDFMQHRMVASYRSFGTTYRSIFKDQEFQEEASSHAFYTNVGVRFAECCIFIIKTHTTSVHNGIVEWKVSRCEAFTAIMLDTGYRQGTMNRIGSVLVMLICNVLVEV
jgi:hypothetical protein